MLLVPTETLREGMMIAQPVLHPERDDLVLLNEGFNLDLKTISHLHGFNIKHVWVSFPGLEELDVGSDPGVAMGHMDLLRVLSRSVDEMEKRVSVKVNLVHYRRAVHHMLGQIVASPEHHPVTHQLAACGPTLAGHLANCSYLALLIGAHLSGYLRNQRRSLPADLAENTAQLGLGALLHDIGKVSMPDELQGKHILDPESSWREYQQHVETGYREVRENVSPVAANIVLHHHQRFDGQGFPGKSAAAIGGLPMGPRGLDGQRIHVFARIVAVADVFDHLLNRRGLTPRPAVMAIHEIKQERFKGWFDPVIVEALLRLIPPFMVGSIVTLSDGNEAAVVANHPEAPCRPTVRILSKPVGEAGAKASRQLDLRMCRNIGIAAVEGEDVRHCLYSGDFESTAMNGFGAAFDAA